METFQFWMGSTKEWLAAPATNGTLLVAAAFLFVAFQGLFRELRTLARQVDDLAKLTRPRGGK
jgi:hypothetical protein